MSCIWYDPLSYPSCAAGAAGSAASALLGVVADAFAATAGHALDWLWSQMNAATAVQLGGPGFDAQIGVVAAIAGVVGLGLFVIQVLKSVLRREPGGLGRAARGLLVAFLGAGAAIAVLDLLLGATDALCQGVAQMATGTDLTGLGRLVLGAGALSALSVGPAALILLALACIASAVIVYLALVVRKVLIVVTAVFAPLAFAGSVADITVSWTRRFIETTVALVVSKLVLVLIFVTGYTMLVEGAGQAGSGSAQQITQVISGIVVLFLAGFSPWLALKVVHFTGDHAQQLHALGAATVGGVAAGGRLAQKAAPYLGRVSAPSPGISGGGATPDLDSSRRATPSGPAGGQAGPTGSGAAGLGPTTRSSSATTGPAPNGFAPNGFAPNGTGPAESSRQRASGRTDDAAPPTTGTSRPTAEPRR